MAIKTTIRTYRCQNSECRHIEKIADIPHTQIKCPECGRTAVKIGTERVGDDD